MEPSIPKRFKRGYINPETGLILVGYKNKNKQPWWVTQEHFSKIRQREKLLKKEPTQEQREAARKRAAEWYQKNKQAALASFAKRREKTREQNRAYQRAYQKKNRSHLLARARDYYWKNRDAILKKWKEENTGKNRRPSANAAAAKRRAYAGQAAVYGQEEAKFLYGLCRTINSAGGPLHHVDHIYPLKPRCKTFCGLHVPNNLRIVPVLSNLRKSNSAPAQMGEMQTQSLTA